MPCAPRVLGTRTEVNTYFASTTQMAIERMMAKKRQQRATPVHTAEPKAAQLRRETRLFRIAKALASGSTVTDIAKAENLAGRRRLNTPTRLRAGN